MAMKTFIRGGLQEIVDTTDRAHYIELVALRRARR